MSLVGEVKGLLFICVTSVIGVSAIAGSCVGGVFCLRFSSYVFVV